MHKQPKIHIFFGAPIITTELKSSEQNSSVQDSFMKWEEFQFLYNDNRPCSSTREKTSDCYDDNNVRIKEECFVHQSANSDTCPSKGTSTEKSHRLSSGFSAAVTVNRNVCEDAARKLDPRNKSGCERHKMKPSDYHEHSQRDLLDLSVKKQSSAHALESTRYNEVLCDSLREYLEGTFPAEPPKSSPPCRPSKTSGSEISAETEYLCVMTASQTAVQIQGQFNIQAHSAETENNKEVRDEDVTLHQNKETFPSTNSFEILQKSEIKNFPKDLKDCGTSHVASMTLRIASSLSSVHEEIGNSQDLFSTPSERSENHIHTRLCHEKLRCCCVSPCSKKPYKRAKISKDAPMNLFKKGSDVHDDFEKANKTYQAYSSITKTELLQRCTDSNIKYHILVTVVHPCHVKEIKLKSGTKAGSRVPLATLVVTDQSGIEMKLILWRAAAFWALTVFPGDVILVTAVTVHEDKWHGEKVLQTTFASKLLNLGFCSTINPQQCLNIIDTLVLQDMLNYISFKCSHLMNIPPRRPQTLEQVVHVELGQLQPDMIAHVIVKVTDITVLTESVYSYKGQRLQKVVLTVEQMKGHRGTLVLWGSGTDWYSQIQKKKDHLWDFRNLIVLANSVSGDLELHTTPWSACECLFNDDKRAVKFKAQYQSEKKLSIKVTDLQSLLTEAYSGESQLRAHVVSLQLTRGTPTITASRYIDSNTPLEMIVAYLSEIIYTGCGNCECPLKTDINNIYEQCNACLPYNKVKMFYSPAVMTVSDGSNVILVHVSPKLLKKIFLNIPADWMKKAIVPSSDVTYGMVAADACHSLVADPPETYLMTIRSYFQLDENSITLYQEFNLIDLHVEL